jgi:L-threonylcarbamoyladenylate synthase
MGRENACIREGSLTDEDACVRALRRGGVVAFPTDTCYGLLADPFSEAAMARLVQLKQVSGPRPWPLLLPQHFDCSRLGCTLSDSGQRLAREFWPGQVTLVVACSGPLAKLVGRAGDGAVGLRVPGGPKQLLRLLETWDGPLVGTSANPSGLPPAAQSQQVEAYFPGELDLVVAGRSPGGPPSTVVDTVNGVAVMRSGAVPDERIREGHN